MVGMVYRINLTRQIHFMEYFMGFLFCFQPGLIIASNSLSISPPFESCDAMNTLTVNYWDYDIFDPVLGVLIIVVPFNN